MKLHRAGVYHEAVFRELVRTAMAGRTWLRHGGNWWAPIIADRQFGLYRRVNSPLTAMREQVESYEMGFYGQLLRGAIGADNVVRSRTRLWRGDDGVYRAMATQRGGGVHD